MIFADLVAGESVFLDANTFIYHFAPDPILGPACSQLLQRIDQQNLVGYISTHILSEVAHRLMTLEASNTFAWPFTGIAYRLKRHPAQVQQLKTFRQDINKVLQSQIHILLVTPTLVATAASISQQTGLMSNDTLTIAVMQANGLANLASHDADFDRVRGLTRYGPG
jgi:predicted nucleic acid-binding protein